ncbi:MAG: hypothetical protein GX444_06195 [Myxococcales bacterium]|nr:hypothetical protein [Myxococcales bacterium]
MKSKVTPDNKTMARLTFTMSSPDVSLVTYRKGGSLSIENRQWIRGVKKRG